MLCFVLSSLNWRYSKSRCLMVILYLHEMHGLGSIFSTMCLWVCQVYSILSRVNITSCSLVEFSRLFHLSEVGLISLNWLSLKRYHFTRHKLLMVLLIYFLRSFLVKNRMISKVRSPVGCFAALSATSLLSIPMWLGIHVSVIYLYVVMRKLVISSVILFLFF